MSFEIKVDHSTRSAIMVGVSLGKLTYIAASSEYLILHEANHTSYVDRARQYVNSKAAYLVITLAEEPKMVSNDIELFNGRGFGIDIPANHPLKGGTRIVHREDTKKKFTVALVVEDRKFYFAPDVHDTPEAVKNNHSMSWDWDCVREANKLNGRVRKKPEPKPIPKVTYHVVTPLGVWVVDAENPEQAIEIAATEYAGDALAAFKWSPEWSSDQPVRL